jgi:hypothetical protein
MSVEGRNSRQMRHTPTHHGATVEAIFERRRTASRYFPFGQASGAGRARQLLTNTFTQAPVDTAAMEEKVYPGCDRGDGGARQWHHASSKE